jgi:hypothetical protein
MGGRKEEELSAGSDTTCQPLTPLPVATAPGTSKMAALMMEAIASAQDDDESCRWSEAGSVGAELSDKEPES